MASDNLPPIVPHVDTLPELVTQVREVADYLRSAPQLMYFCKFDGTQAAPVCSKAQLIVPAVTKLGVGNYRLQFTRALAVANYIAFPSVSGAAGFLVCRTANQLADRLDFQVQNLLGVATDDSNCCLVVVAIGL